MGLTLLDHNARALTVATTTIPSLYYCNTSTQRIAFVWPHTTYHRNLSSMTIVSRRQRCCASVLDSRIYRKIAVKYAKDNKIAVAVKSGGHQYSGASSTSGDNILIDMKPTYKNVGNDFKILDRSTDKAFIYCRVSFSLGELNGFLKMNGLFVPHGQCADVHVGGHAQTGGYGQLGRSFGLLGDHVREIRLVDHNADLRTIDASSDPDLFNAILGGSPSNFGVITHYTLEVHRDSDHDFKSVGGQGPHGLRAVWWYNKATLEALLTKVAEMADNPEFPRNYDLCVSVLSSDFSIDDLVPEMDGVMRRDHPEIYGLDGQAH